MSELRFDGQVAIVTGAGSTPGLGRSYAKLLAARGAKVVVNDLGVGPDGSSAVPAKAAAVVEEIKHARGEAVADTHSVASEDGAQAIVETALKTYGRVDILVNNAGVVEFALFDEFSTRDIDKLIETHVYGAIWMCRAVWPHMKAARYQPYLTCPLEIRPAGWAGGRRRRYTSGRGARETVLCGYLSVSFLR